MDQKLKYSSYNVIYFSEWKNYFIVIGWGQANLSLILIRTTVKINARAFASFLTSHTIDE